MANTKGDRMPQSGFSSERRRTGAHHNTCKAKCLLNGHIPDARWINRADPRHGATESTEDGPLDRPHPRRIIYGCFNSGYGHKSTKAVSPKNPSTLSARADGAAAGRLEGAAVPGCAAASGAARFGALTPSGTSGQAGPDPSSSASRKKQRGKKYFRNKKKRDGGTDAPGGYTHTLMALQENEDWEEEIQEVALRNRGEMSSLTTAYGPEDVLYFSLQDLTLRQSDWADPLAAADYVPAVHHAHPIRWRCCHVPVQSEQFADAEE
ncbi:uncharacterized protein V3H82_003243 [Fundulus diaphanus]